MRALIVIIFVTCIGCSGNRNTIMRIPVAEVGKSTLYLDEIPAQIYAGTGYSDSITLIRNYVNTWARRQLLLLKAEDNLTEDLKNEVNRQLDETRANLLIHQYQQQMLLKQLDTVISHSEMEQYYINNEKAFTLTSNIVKALFIKIPVETPGIDKLKTLVRSNTQSDMQQLESFCFQFAETFDDFNENWITMDRLSVELHQDIDNEENFLRWNTFYETADSSYVYMISIRDYRLRSTTAPFDYVKDDIKRIIWNTRRLELIQSIENGLYNDALKENRFKTYIN